METLPNVEACRICANLYVTTSDIEFLNLFEPTQPLHNELIFIEAELRAWQLNISCNDGLPQRICGNCFTKFCSIYSFRQECLEAQQKLLQAFVEGGDCVEEVVTAQESSSVMNGPLPTNIDSADDGIIGFESMLQGHAEEQIVPATIVGENNSFQYIKNENILIPKEEEQPIELQQPEFKVAYNNIMQIQPETTTVVQPLPHLTNVAFSNNAAHMTQNKIMNQEIDIMEAQDLEEVLQGNYIHKTKKEEVEVEETDNLSTGNDADVIEFDDTSDSSSSLEDEEQSNSRNPLACQYCYASAQRPLVFSTAEDLSQHFFDAHDPTFPYTCPECPQSFNSSKTRLHHVKEQHTIFKRACKYCGKVLKGLSQKEHLDVCHYIGDWECDFCGLEFKQVTHFTFRAHIKRDHQHAQKKPYKCTICGRLFTLRQEWKDHKALHVNNSLLWCDICKEAFANTYELNKHKYKKHNGDLPVSCDYCCKGFSTYAFLNRHISNFHPEKLDDSGISAFSCTNCGMYFSSLHKLRNHQQKQRDENGQCINLVYKKYRPLTNTGIYACPHCTKRFHIKSQLEKHLPSHDIFKRPYKCDKCHVMFRSPSELKNHQDIAHMQIKAFVCEQCGKKFGYKKDLRDHMLYHEEINRPCPESGCSYICRNDKVLNEHIRQKHRLLACDYCKQTFTRQRLTMHLRNVHNVDIGDDLENMQLNGQEKVVVEFVGNRTTNDLGRNTQHELPQSTSSVAANNHYEDYAMEQIVELEQDNDHEIVVT